MDDKGLQNPNSQVTNPPPAVTDDQVNKPATPPPSKSTPLPPPSIPSAPPMAAGVTPPPTPPGDDKPIPTEEVKMSKPKRRLGKNAKKIVGGVIMLALLVGGVVVGRNMIEERQVVESEAKKATTEGACESLGCTGVKGQKWKWVKGKCVKRKNKSWCQDVGGTGYKTCNSWSGNNCAGLKPGDPCKNDPSGTCIQTPGYLDDPVLTNEIVCGCKGKAEPSEASPTPSATPSPTPSATPSPGPGISCVGLRSDTDPIEYGDTVTFTCEGSFSSASNPYAQFSGHVNDVGIYASSNIPIDPITNTATYDMEINEWGDWEIQCRVCADGVGCTEWGEAN